MELHTAWEPNLLLSETKPPLEMLIFKCLSLMQG